MAEPSLADHKCIPCDKGGKPLKGAALAALARQLPEWQVVEEHHLRREFNPDISSVFMPVPYGAMAFRLV